ncbi:TMEM175 [Branchiostoma lanceolatum]|uniref:Endosomal/lysosomal proton channel TMEM175 n=1 Tax=Branchiostoma lanceolatum TaxID=7740 RepID=A0A8J9Z2K1_BRALA|nr:TMEM175 [Branchiostoma lanceolatum]
MASTAEDHGHVQSAGRMQAYSDAIFSIVATVMILPVAHTEIPEDKNLREVIFYQLLPKIFIYILSFFVVAISWSAHVWLFQIVQHADDVTTLLNLLIMMIITFLPFTFTLMGTFPDFVLAIVLFCVCIIVLSLAQALVVLHVFRNPQIMEESIKNSENKTAVRNALLLRALMNAILCTFAAVFSPASFVVSYAFLVMILFSPNIAVQLSKLISKFSSGSVQMSQEVIQRGKSYEMEVNKERVECYSDGVFAIVATLIILDICEKDIPSRAELKYKYKNDLVAALDHDSSVFLAYFGTFATVGLLWYIHHSLYHHLKRTSRLMAMFNNFSLAMIGGMPLAFKLTSMYDDTDFYNNERVAIQLSCVIMFLASISQLAIFVTALFRPDQDLIDSAKVGGQSHYYLLVKLLVYPTVSMIIYVISLTSDVLSVEAFHVAQLGTPALFFILWLIVIKIQRNVQEVPNPEEQSFQESINNEEQRLLTVPVENMNC